MNISNTIKFLYKYITHPRTTGAVCPSSCFLARRMVKGIEHENTRNSVVVELGAGTGAVTKSLVKFSKANQWKIFSIEFDTALADVLARDCPQANVINDSAENIRAIVGKDTANIRAIVSSLPFLSLPKECALKIVEEIEASLPEGGRFVQYTYNLNHAPETLSSFKSMRHLGCSKVFLNIPPARVDVYEKV